MPKAARHLTFISLLSLLSSACNTERARVAATAQRDSLGVSIVDNIRPAGRGWTVDSVAGIVVGASGRGAEYDLSGVSGAVRLADGVLAIANGGSLELRFYTVSGEFLHAFGGEGDGPGEFARISRIGRYRADSVWVYDAVLKRLTIVESSTLGFRSFSNRGHGESFVHSARDDGSFLVWRVGRPTEYDGPARLVWDTTIVLVMGPLGQDIDTLGRFPLRQELINRDERRGGLWTSIPLHLRAEASGAAAGGGLYWGIGDAYQIRRYNGSGSLGLIINRAAEPRAVTASVRSAYIDRYLGRLAARRRVATTPAFLEQRRRRLEQEEFAATVPPYDRLLVDATDQLWVRRYAAGSEEALTWDVFGPAGEWMTTITLPNNLSLSEIGGDYLLGIHRDVLGIETVRGYEIKRR